MRAGGDILMPFILVDVDMIIITLLISFFIILLPLFMFLRGRAAAPPDTAAYFSRWGAERH